MYSSKAYLHSSTESDVLNLHGRAQRPHDQPESRTKSYQISGQVGVGNELTAAFVEMSWQVQRWSPGLRIFLRKTLPLPPPDRSDFKKSRVRIANTGNIEVENKRPGQGCRALRVQGSRHDLLAAVAEMLSLFAKDIRKPGPRLSWHAQATTGVLGPARGQCLCSNVHSAIERLSTRYYIIELGASRRGSTQLSVSRTENARYLPAHTTLNRYAPTP
ncbi:hypothetical protein C8Q77DRAFT_811442 [Trametes polyzona]|nr:hypothetical protein C8Q77DRAFT_811442 [Trametes polyzona]